jgi:hypothetical protein
MLPLLGQSGLSPVMMTGEVVLNAKKDMQEYESRQGDFGVGGLIHISHIAQNDMVFIRKGKQPVRSQGFGDNEYAIDVFAAWNGATHELDDAFEFVGIARAPPMHQNMQGRETMEAGFALQIGGSRTLRCISHSVIPIGSRLVWKIPRDLMGLPEDNQKHGRILAEICAYKPTNAIVAPHNLHNMIYNQMHSKIDIAALNVADRAAYQNAWKVWEGMQSLAFSSILSYLAFGTDANGTRLYPNGVIPSLKKLEIAEQLGLVQISDRAVNSDATKKRFRDTTALLLDTLFQSKVTGDLSAPSKDLTAFPFTVDGGYNPDAKERAVSAKQAVAYNTLYDTIIVMYDSEKSREFGWTMNGAAPGQDIDVVLKRVA